MNAKNNVAEILQENERLKQELQLVRNNNTILVKEIYGNSKQRSAISENNINSKTNLRTIVKAVKPEITDEEIEEIPKNKVRKNPEKTVIEDLYEQKFPKERAVEVEHKKKRLKPYVFTFIMIFGICFNMAYINAVGDGYKDSIERQVKTVTDSKSEIERQGNAIQKSRNDIDGLKEQINNDIDGLKEQINKLSDTVSKLSVEQKSNSSTLNNISKSTLTGYYLVNGTDKHDLAYVKNLVKSWTPLMEYKENVYDCSNMSTHLEWYLETNGVKADIVMGQPEWADKIHAWVYAYGNFGKVAIEATKKNIVYKTGPFWVDADASYYDSKRITAVYPSIGDVPKELTGEFDWRSLLTK